MATQTHEVMATRVKWGFFALIGLCALAIIPVDERFLIDPADPHWAHIAPVKWLLLVHGLGGLTALTTGALQFSSRLRARTSLHRAIGRVYIGAVTVSAPLAIYIGTGPIEPVTIHVEQWFQGGLWWLSAIVALICIRNRHVALHRLWMMRSYGFTLIFILARVPDIFWKVGDQFLADLLWSLVAAALIAPDVIMTVQEVTRVRRARLRHRGQPAADSELAQMPA
jgi:hypothetical protein